MCADIIIFMNAISTFFQAISKVPDYKRVDQARREKTTITLHMMKTNRAEALAIPLDFSERRQERETPDTETCP